MASINQVTTAEQLLETPDVGRCELVNGELVMMSPAGYDHGRVAFQISFILGSYGNKHAVGQFSGAETGFLITRDPDTVRAPDIGFVRAERALQASQPGFFDGAPDLAVEVMSPGDRARSINEKVRDWLMHGTSLVWVVNLPARTLTAHRPEGEPVVYTEGDWLDAPDLLPGFQCQVSEIFPSKVN